MQVASGTEGSLPTDDGFLALEDSMEVDDQSGSGSQSPVEKENRIAPGSSIPVWKIDKATGTRKAVTNLDLSY